ncbi:PspA-associated protein PspAA [Nocardia australiensis]|uniref:PspA-associated protein PspAA n=1 Tax=Nocardia australiensis TaxID=2887191 RepID=UPI001D142072|nr:hypothetical protein [Nocardia australiensis]
MIIRILGEGQYSVTDADIAELNTLDDLLLKAADADDTAGFAEILHRLRDTVCQRGTVVPEDTLVVSDLVLPSAGTALTEVRAMLADDGLIPG